MTLSELYSDEIKALCLKYKVKRLSAFGSIVKGGFNKESDIDLIVDFEPLSNEEYTDNYFYLKFALEDKFHRSIDLLEEKEIKNPHFKKNIDAHQQTIYAS
jgi:predicted nucleotidyltransferase